MDKINFAFKKNVSLQKLIKIGIEMEYTAIIQDIGDGWYMGQCEQVPGAMTQGRSIEEVNENLKDAIQLVLDFEKEQCQKKYTGKRFVRRKIAML